MEKGSEEKEGYKRKENSIEKLTQKSGGRSSEKNNSDGEEERKENKTKTSEDK